MWIYFCLRCLKSSSDLWGSCFDLNILIKYNSTLHITHIHNILFQSFYYFQNFFKGTLGLFCKGVSSGTSGVFAQSLHTHIHREICLKLTCSRQNVILNKLATVTWRHAELMMASKLRWVDYLLHSWGHGGVLQYSIFIHIMEDCSNMGTWGHLCKCILEFPMITIILLIFASEYHLKRYFVILK